MRNPMLTLKKLDMELIAQSLDVHLATVYRWRNGQTCPKAIQVYQICSLLRLRPTTFAPYTEHPVLYKMPSSVFKAPPPEKIGEWVRERIDACRKLDWANRRALVGRCGLDRKTVKKCIESDDIGWDYLLWFIEIGLRVLPWHLLDVTSGVPIPHTEEGFADYTQKFSRYVPGGPQTKPRKRAKKA